MIVHKQKYYFSVQQLATQRSKFQHKICFKESLSYLKLKSTPAVSVSSRLYRDGNFLRIYKQLQKAFLTILLPSVKSLPHNNEFKNLCDQYQSFNDINRVLFWKLTAVNCLFNIKKLKNKRILFYLKPERRAVLVLLWLKNLVKLKKKDQHNCSFELFSPIFNFISANRNNNDIFSLKLRVYKLRLARG